MTVAIRNRGRDSKNVKTRQGGNLALADFHVTPPLGSSMLNRVGIAIKGGGEDEVKEGELSSRERFSRSTISQRDPWSAEAD